MERGLARYQDREVGPGGDVAAQLTEAAMSDLFETKKKLGLPDRRLRKGGSTSCYLPSPAPKAAAPTESDINQIVEAVLKAIGKRS